MKFFFKIFVIWIFIFLFLEISSIIFFPKFKSRVVESYDNYSITNNKKSYYKNLYKDNKKIKIRDSKIDNNITNIDNLVHIIGDSVSAGYGLSYQNTYYSITENLLNKLNIKTNIISYAGNGADLNSQLNNFTNVYRKNKSLKKEILIYQFAYNDLTIAYIYGHGKGYEYFGPKERSKLSKKIAVKTAGFRYKYLNKSNFLSLIQFYIGKIRYKPWKKNCIKRGIYSLGEWSYAFRAKGFEKNSEIIWKKFEDDLKDLKNFALNNNIELYVLISPLSIQIPYHEEMNIYNYDMNCATIDAREHLKTKLNNLHIKFIDPLDDMITYSINYKNENNKENFFFDLDYAHPNELGSRIIAETFFKKMYHELKL